jgi:phosphatidylethanolamine-binding protein (PEBP) family uncharacterized protein
VKMRYLSALCISALALALASCGSSGSPVAAEKAIVFGSPAIAAGRVVPAHYKCDTRNVWLPLRWGTLPPNTRELALYIVRFGTPGQSTSGAVKAEIKAESIILGLRPTLRQLSPGKFPHGALVAVHAPGGQVQSICPPKGATQNLLFRLYALRRKLHLTRQVRKENLVAVVTKEALEVGTFITSYRPA